MNDQIDILMIAGNDAMGIIANHHARFFEMYAGCRTIEYIPFVTIPRFVRFEHFVPRDSVALR